MMLRIKTILFVLLLLLLAGCASTEPSRFYALTPMPGSDAGVLSETLAQDVTIGVGPVRIPDYLDRQQIVTSSRQHKRKLAEFDRWAGSLKDSFVLILSENLSALLATDRVFTYPWRGSLSIDYQIEVEVVQFDGELGGNASLIARWTIFDAKEKKVLLVKKSNITESAGAQGYEALVAAQSRTLGHLSRDIAAAVKSVSREMSDQ